MPEPSARLAAKDAWLRMRRLLFPFSLRHWLALYIGQRIRRYDADPAIAELRRIRPYYRGTRMLTMAGLLLILLAFVIPFFVVVVSWDVFVIILLVYAVLFLVSSLTGMVVQSAMDAVFALQYKQELKFGEALKTYLSLVRSHTDLTLGYMSIKLAVDFSLSTLALSFFLPALLSAMALMVYMTDAVRDGADMGSDPYIGLLIVALLAILGFIATLLIALPAAAFYGYYTEEAVKMMTEAHPEAILHPEKAG